MTNTVASSRRFQDFALLIIGCLLALLAVTAAVVTQGADEPAPPAPKRLQVTQYECTYTNGPAECTPILEYR